MKVVIGHKEKKQYLHYGNYRRIESILKAIMTENLPNLDIEMVIQIHEAHRS